MFRASGSLVRWVSAPALTVERRVLQFTNVTDQEYTAATDVMSDAEAEGLVADLAWALPQMSAFPGFVDERFETAPSESRVRVSRPGRIVVARYAGLQAATGFWGYGRWQTSGGEVVAGIVMLDLGFDTSGSLFRRSLRAHELGHALGYNHVTRRESVMNSSARIEPNPFDRTAMKLAFQRPPLNRSPDIDPDPFTANLRGIAERLWHGDK
jgi:predicted Zn-dependent protease